MDKYHKSGDTDFVKPETASAFAVHDGRGTTHVATVDTDPLVPPRTVDALSVFAPGESSNPHVVMLLVATSVGASIVAAPCAFLLGGFGMTIVMALFLALASTAANICLVQLGVAHGIYSLQGLAYLAFGPPGARAVGVTQLAVSCGLVLAYLAVVFQDLPVLLGHALDFDFDATGWPIASTTILSRIIANRALFAELMAFVIVIPLCLVMHTYAKVRGAALVTTALLVLLSLCVVGKAKSLHDINAPSASQGYRRDYLVVPPTVSQAFGILAMLFANQHHTFHAFAAMRTRSIRTFVMVAATAGIVATYLVYSFGIGGYVSYLGATKSDVVQNVDFVDESRSMLPFWFAVPIVALLCLPLEVVSARYTTQCLLIRTPTASDEHQHVLFRAQQPPPAAHSPSYTSAYDRKLVSSDLPHDTTGHRESSSIVLSSGASYTRMQIACTAVVLAILVQIVALVHTVSVAAMLSVTGGIAGIALVLIIPPACVLQLRGIGASFHSSSDGSSSSSSHHVVATASRTHWFLATVLPWSSIVIGVVASIACVISNIVHHDEFQ